MDPNVMMPMDKLRISQWVKNGCPATSVKILQPPSAVSYPNSFVIMCEKPVVSGAKTAIPYICLDVH